MICGGFRPMETFVNLLWRLDKQLWKHDENRPKNHGLVFNPRAISRSAYIHIALRWIKLDNLDARARHAG